MGLMRLMIGLMMVMMWCFRVEGGKVMELVMGLVIELMVVNDGGE